MKKLMTGVLVAILVGAAGAVAIAFSGGGRAQAHEEEQTVAQNQEEQQPEQEMVYHYAAQPGDSYTLMARKAVQTYGKKYEVNLSQAGIIYAETHLTQQAGSPVLEVGQSVDMNESTVKQWVEKAQDLSAEAEAAWNYYAQFANFNTDNVGESR